jgi:nitrogen fixation protein NifZ
MKPAYEYGDEVRLIRNVRNDGTYPGKEVGELLIKRGSAGVVYDVGTYLQDQLIYRVHFLDQNKTVGCREEELIPVHYPWIDNRFEFRDNIVSRVRMSSDGEPVVSPGDAGEVARVIHEEDGALWYHVQFGDFTFQVPEAAICTADEFAEEMAAHNSSVIAGG